MTATTTRLAASGWALAALSIALPACSHTVVFVGEATDGAAAGDASGAGSGAGTSTGGGTPGGCRCIGYDEVADVCTWTGGPIDPGLSNEAAWTTKGSVVIDANAAGSVSPGVARFDSSFLGKSGGSLSQRLEMPDQACAEALALTFDVRAGTSQQQVVADGGLAVAVAGGWLSSHALAESPWSAWRTETKCLGERAYRDGPIDLVFEALDPWSGGPLAGVALELDEVRVVPEPDCPAPQTTPNGDFEAGGTGWSASPPSGVFLGAGSLGSRGGRLSSASPCDGASLRGVTSTPMSESLATPALALWTSGSSARGALVAFDGRGVASLPRHPGPEVRVCIPRWAQGLTGSIAFSLPAAGGSCALPVVNEISLDDFAYVTEVACDLAEGIADPGFENAAEAPSTVSWVERADQGAHADRRVDDPFDAQAHTGVVAARLSTTRYCASARLSTTITVPDASGASGPAVRLWYRSSATTAATTALLDGEAGVALPPTEVWTRRTLCIDSARAGHPAGLTLRIGADLDTCQATFPEEVAWFDDVEVTTDPSCPP